MSHHVSDIIAGLLEQRSSLVEATQRTHQSLVTSWRITDEIRKIDGLLLAICGEASVRLPSADEQGEPGQKVSR